MNFINIIHYMNALKVLMIDDDTIEIMKLNRTVSSMNLDHQITDAKNGEQALNILKQKDGLPDIILLDLNMPKINGIEFLTILKAKESLMHIPIVIVTTSSNNKDLLQCYKLGIAGYIIKPLKYKDYVNKIKKVLDYWSVNQLIKN